jgi:hypothetical protein
MTNFSFLQQEQAGGEKGRLRVLLPRRAVHRQGTDAIKRFLSRLLVEKHFADRHLIDRHLADRHLIDRHLIDRHLIDRHLIDRHLIDRHLIDPPVLKETRRLSNK